MNWLNLETFLLDAARSATGLALNWLIQSSLLIAGGLVVGYALSRRGSAVQSAVYRTTLVAVLVAPLVTWALALAGVNGWSLSMPTAYSVEALAMLEVNEDSRPAQPVAVADAEAIALGPAQAFEDSSLAFEARPEAFVPDVAQRADVGLEINSAESLDHSTTTASSESAKPVAPPQAFMFSLRGFGIVALGIGAVWLCVAAWFLGRLALACRRLSALRRGAWPAEPPTIATCREVAALLEVRPPDVVCSPYLPSPCLMGVRRPAVMLPETDMCLPLRDVLVHELAHLRRHDCFWNLLRRAAVAVLFFQPLLWRLSRRLEATADEVCDDYVVHYGGDRHTYAHRLVDVAELSLAPAAAAGVGIVSLRSMLAHRVARIMDTSRALSTRVGSVLLVLVLMTGLFATVLVGLVGVEPERAAADGSADAAGAREETSEDDYESQESTDLDVPSGVFIPASQFEEPAAQPGDEQDEIVVRGQVLGPDGEPFGGATVHVTRWYWDEKVDHPPLATTTSGADGRFTISYRKSQFNTDMRRRDMWKEVTIIAAADGYGPGWVSRDKLKSNEEPILRLVPDDTPITGRVVDLEGNPIAGVTVKFGGLAASTNENLTPFLDAIDRGELLWQAANRHLDRESLPQLPANMPKQAVTDQDGSFRVTGAGRERRLNIQLEGPTIALTSASVVTRNMSPIVANTGLGDPEWVQKTTIYGADFEVAAPPTQPIIGTARDAATGAPLAGVEVHSYRMSDRGISAGKEIRVTSDRDGRYRLVGMPKGSGRQIMAMPNDDQPYLMREFDVPDAPGLEAVELDLELHRGVVITGRVTDKQSGKPVGYPAEVWLYYLPYRTNEFARTLPEYDIHGNVDGYQDRYKAKADGTFRLVGLPGHAIVGLSCWHLSYPKGMGSETIEGIDEKTGHFPTYHAPLSPSRKWPTAMKEVEISEGASKFELDFELDAGRSLEITTVDTDGREITGVAVLGLPERDSSWQTTETATSTAKAFAPQEQRTMLFHHKIRNIGRVIRAVATEESPSAITVTLQPCAAIRGRLVDGDDQPITDASIRFDVRPGGDFEPGLIGTASDAEGRFEHTGVLPGANYAVFVESPKHGFKVAADDLEVQPGETVDLGTVDLTSEARPEPLRMMAEATVSATDQVDEHALDAEDTATTNADLAPAKAYEFAGEVVTPDGNPAAGAKVFLVYFGSPRIDPNSHAVEPLAVTDAAGKFRFTVKPVEFFGTDRTFYAAEIVAVAEGYGFGTALSGAFETSGTLLAEYRAAIADAPVVFRANMEKRFEAVGGPLRLVADDEPIRGRVIDINGQSVAGARLSLEEVWACLENDLTPWLEAAQEPKADYYSARMKTPWMINAPQVQSLVAPALSDDEGRFTLRGIGHERIVQLRVDGPGIETSRIFARTRTGEAIELWRERRSPDLGTYVYHSAELTHLAGPSKPIVGVVRDRQTRKPLAGITIRSQKRHGHAITGLGEDFVRTVTDDEGRYRLEGMPIGEDNEIAAVAPIDVPYLPTTMSAETDGDGAEVTVDFEMQRGVWLEGRLTDSATGTGMPGWVEHFVYLDNPLLEGLKGTGEADMRDRYQADDDGRFRIPALTGRGIVAIMAFDADRYPRGAGAENIPKSSDNIGAPNFKTHPADCMPANFNVLAPVDIPADAQRYEVNLEVSAKDNIQGHILDAGGRPLTGAQYSGKLAQYTAWDYAEADQFEVVGYKPDAPRRLMFYHAARNLAGMHVLRGDVPKEPVVTLQPAGKVTGRLVDDDGEPLSGMSLTPWRAPRSSPIEMQPTDGIQPDVIPLPPNVEHWRSGQHETDADGRFEISGLVPGAEYLLEARDRESNLPLRGQRPRHEGSLEHAIIVEPGQALDLGDVRLVAESQRPAVPKSQAASRTTAADKKAATKEQVNESQSKPVNETAASTGGPAPKQIMGHVVAPDSKPVAGAKIYWITWSLRGPQPPPQLVATTDKKGAFKFAQPDTGTRGIRAVDQMPHQNIVVMADGYGVEYTSPTPPRRNALGVLSQLFSGLTIQLRPDAAVKGRIVDIDGQPVAGARVSIRKISGGEEGGDAVSRRDLEVRGRDKESIDWRLRLNELTHRFFPAQLASIAPTTTSDENGQFTLNGVGANRLVQLLIQGDRIQSSLVLSRTIPGESITVQEAPNFGLDKETLHGPEFTHVAGPSKPLVGRVLDIDTGEPIAGAVVRAYAVHGEDLHSSRERQHFSAISDRDGRYHIVGLPSGDENKLVAFTTGDVPYVPVGAVLDTAVDGTAVTHDFRLKRGVWAEGRAYDATTKRPLAGELTYYMFRNPKMEETVPGLRHAFVDEHYFTDADGKFRVPVPATRGVLAFRYAPIDSTDVQRYPRGVGAESISGGEDAGGMMHFPTIPHYLMPSNYQRVAEVAPEDGAETISLDFPLSEGGKIKVRVVDEAGQPLARVQFQGHSDNSGWQSSDGNVCEIIALQPGEARKLFFHDPTRNLVGALTVDSETDAKPEVKLSPGGSLRGRLVNDDGEPLTGVTLSPIYEKLASDSRAATWPPHPGLIASPTQIPTDQDGRFQLDGLIPGWKYSAWAIGERKMDGRMMSSVIGKVFEDVTVEPGQTLDLGEVEPMPLEGLPADKVKTSSETKSNRIDNSKDTAASQQSAIRISGKVIGPDGAGIEGATIAAIGRPKRIARGGDFEAQRDRVLAETTTDGEGRYEIALSGVSPKTYFRAAIIASAEGMGISWKRPTAETGLIEMSFALVPEQPLRGRLVDIEGAPAVGVRAAVNAVMRTGQGRLMEDGVSFDNTNNTPAAWPKAVTTNDQGEYVISNVAAGHGMFLNVEGNDRFAPQTLAINTGMEEERGERDGTYRPQVVKNLQAGEEAVLALAPAQIFEGTVRYEDTREPAPHARLTIWASQQKFGSMSSLAGKADVSGRYKISPYPGIRFGVTAYPPDGAPYLTREMPQVHWEDADTKKTLDVTLPRGVLVRGKVIESATGAPVSGATIQYVPESVNNKHAADDILTGWQGIQLANDDGQFEIVVLPGPGRLLIHGPEGEFVLQESSSRELTRGTPGGERNYANAIVRLEPEPGSEPVDVEVKLTRSLKVTGQISDESGQPVDDALLISSLNIHPLTLSWRGDASKQVVGGSFEVTGLEANREYVVHFLDAKRRLGATVKLKAGDGNPTIVLRPCGQATARFIDENGEPRADYRPMLQFVAKPGAYEFDFKAMELGKLAADSDFVSNIDRTNHWNLPPTDAEGRITFPALIPGATYWAMQYADGDSSVAKEFTVESQQTLDLGDIIVEQQN